MHVCYEVTNRSLYSLAVAAVWVGLTGCLAHTLHAQFDPRHGFGNSQQARDLVNRVEIPIADEERIGAQSFESFSRALSRKGIVLADRGKLHAYATGLVKRIHPHMRHARRYRAIRVWIARSDETDAHAFPGGRIVVAEGMIRFAESEAALVGVLAHELSHIDRFHQLEQIRSYVAAQRAFQSGAVRPEQFLAGAQLMMNAFARPFRPEQEAVADADAVRWMMRLGYQPAEFARLFERLEKRDGKRMEMLPAFLRSHPSRGQRREMVAETAVRVAREERIDRRRLVAGRESWRAHATKKSPAP